VNAIAIRRAKVADAREVALLLKGLGPDFHISTAEAARQLRITTDSTFVAGKRGHLTGLVSIHTTHPVYSRHRYGRIMAIVVRRDLKRTGVGRALMRFALSYLGKLGCRKIELTSRIYRGGAHKFYRAMGFKATSVRFSKLLKG